MRIVVLGLLLGLLAAFPALSLPLLAAGGHAARLLAAQPVVWAFAAGVVTGPRILRRLRARTPGSAR